MIDLQYENEIDAIDYEIGMDSKIIETLFTYDKTKARTGVSGERGVGLGLANANEIMEESDLNIMNPKAQSV